MKTAASILLLIVVQLTLSLALQQGDPCPTGGGSFCAGISLLERPLILASFSPYIYRCYTNGTGDFLSAGNCNDNV